MLAGAGLERLGLQRHVKEWIPLELMLPAPGQGALAVQCRVDDRNTLGLLSALDHEPTRNAITAERGFLSGLGGGCAVPVAAFAWVGPLIRLQGLVASPDGRRIVRVAGEDARAHELGARLARQALSQGAGEILALRSAA